MENPVTHYEQTEFEKLIRAEIGREHDENSRQNKRLDTVEEKIEKQSELITEIRELTLSVKGMQEQLSGLNDRIEIVEGRDGEMWRKVVSYAVTAIVGGVIAFALARIGMG